ncbi:putative dehydrogenase [Bacillus tianshenii]|uniref:Dehydrogenase n=1 Tax=Sutcliffiella tianshenii TaxID=1463404 RepID=A0ABS2NU82_9BACI|nr:Gfo/Idh/MocA family oxidoreductase [Bacillus tianshenii]MBM7618201.1 putative dehydrogenase [Bacillus tianshenii]
MGLRIGIIGTGQTIGVATDHLKGIQAVAEWELTAIYDIKYENAKRWTERNNLSESIICSSLEEVFEKVDAITICTDNLSHGIIAREAMKRKVHVLCEKPLSIDYHESRILSEEAKNAGIVNYMGMQYRYHPYAQLIKEIIEDGRLGEIFSYRHKLGGWRIGNPNVGMEWRMNKETSGPGAVADFGIHQVDLIHFFLQEACGPIQEVQAELATYIPYRKADEGKGVVTNDDLAAVILKLQNGAICTLNNSRLLPPEGDGLEIVGTKGAVSMNQQGEVFFRNRTEDGSWAAEAERVDFQGKHKFSGLARGKQYKEFFEAIAFGKEHELSFAYGAAMARVIDAAVLSSEQGRRVKISEI